MRKKILPLALVLALLLTGCGWMDGSYVYVEPHVEHQSGVQTGNVSASDYFELRQVLEQLVNAGTETCTVDVGDMDQDRVEGFVQSGFSYIRTSFPMGAYAIEDISYELGSNNGRPAVAISIQYRRSRTEMRRVRQKPDMEALAEAVRDELDDHSGRVAFLVEEYSEMDFQQLVQDYAREEPRMLMEVPQVSEGIYGIGSSRIVELSFTYQNSREALRQMQQQVRLVFEAASLYVSGEGSDHQKFSQLYGFLVERFDYKLETSITPAYSLLCHGVGDSRAFAEVYASMCRRVGLECLIVTGTRDGAPWTWNMVKDGENYYHVDLLRRLGSSDFREYSDGEMGGYVWDYSAYPACELIYQEPVVAPPTEPTVPQESQPEPSTEATVPESSPNIED